MKEEDKPVKVLPTVRRLIHSKLAHFCIDSKGSDIYHFMGALMLLKCCVGDKPLKDYYGDKYPKILRKLNVINKKMNKIKLFYDSIPKDDKEIEEKINDIFERNFSKVTLCDATLFNCFRILLEKTEIRFLPIPNDCFASVERTTKKYDSGVPESKGENENRTK